MKPITRRDYLKKTAAWAMGSTLLLNRPLDALANLPEAAASSKVVLIRNQQLFAGSDRPDPVICGQMIDEALCALTGIKDPKQAWSSLIKPSDIVGVKTNEWNALPTPPEVNEVLKARVLQAGVPEDKVSVKDRGVLNDPVFKDATALINARPLRTHAWSGIGSCIKNYIMFAPKPSGYHDDSCASLAALHELPITKGKTRLHILVLFTPSFHHVAPHHISEEYVWKYSGLLMGFDPVAVDSVGLRILQAKRNEYFKEDKPLNPPAKHVALADTRYHLGTADPSKIELFKLGWDAESYI